MSMPIVSIIIPIYKVESYLRRCLDSVVNQTYTNLEIILVDDGSPDNCPQICEEYAAKDERVIVVHKKNGGQAEARNLGIDICKGDYISFVDSDDWVAQTYIEELLDLILKEKADVAVCELIRTHSYKEIEPQRTDCCQSYTSAEALRRLFLKREVSFIGPVCKIYRRSLFKTTRFPIGKFHEDEFTAFHIFNNAVKVVYTPMILYYYFQRADSTMGTPHPYDLLEAEEVQFDFILKNGMADITSSQARLICWQILYIYSRKTNVNFEAKLRYYAQYLKAQKNPIVQFFLLKFFCRFPYLYSALRCVSPILIRK